MLTKTLAGGILAVLAGSAVWWYVDPVGFSQNPLLTWLRGLSVPLPGHR
jgi:hypothetical protein